MNKYKVVKWVMGKSIQDVLDIEKTGEIVYIDLQEESSKIGFDRNETN